MNLYSKIKFPMKKTILLASLASLLCFTVNPVLADQSQMEWDEWKVMGDGYFARRQVPSRFSEEVSQRQSADVVDRDSGVRSIALGYCCGIKSSDSIRRSVNSKYHTRL